MNRAIIFSSVGAAVVIAIVVLTTTLRTNKNPEVADFYGEFSANGRITSSSLENTPVDLGESGVDAQFAVYFARDESTKQITFELSISAKGDNQDELLKGSVKDGRMTFWTNGDVANHTTQQEFLDLVSNYADGDDKLFDCSDTHVNLDSWKDNYSVSKSGDVVTLNLGSGGSVYFKVGTNGFPETVTWGGVVGSIESFKEDASFRGTLGKDVPDSLKSACTLVTEDSGVDVSDLPEVSQADAQTTIDDLSRRLKESQDNSSRKLSTTDKINLKMIQMSIAAYDKNSCGSSGWTPWFSMSNSNAYAQVCWSGPSNKCTLAMRGSDDSSDWYSNIIGNTMGTSSVGGINIPIGFKDEFDKLKASSTWNTWNWARTSQWCAGGIYVTGHSLGGAMASAYVFEAAAGGNDYDLVTFASPAIGGKNQQCGGGDGRFYLDSDPVPGLPPWMDHTSKGEYLEESMGWFTWNYYHRSKGCGDQGGGGFNFFKHSSLEYEKFIKNHVY